MEISIGKTIKKLRAEKGVTQEELAKYLNITFQSVSKWETEAATPDISLLPKLAIFFGVKIDDLFCITDSDTFERIDYMLEHEHTISDENFIYASRFLDERLKINENDSETLKRYARLYLHRINRYNLAAGRCLRKAIESAPFDNSLIGMFIQQKESRWESPVTFLEEILEKYPSHIFIKERLVSQYIKERQFNKVRELIKNLREIEDKPIYAMYDVEIELNSFDKERMATVLINIAENYGEKDSYIYWEVGDKFDKTIHDCEKALYYFKKHFENQTQPRKL